MEKTVEFEQVNWVSTENPNSDKPGTLLESKSDTVKQDKLRFKETTEERPMNDEWISMNNKIDEEEILVSEIKENEDNF